MTITFHKENNMNLEEIHEITKSATLDWYSGDKELVKRVRAVTLSEFHRKVTPSVVMELLDQIEILSRGSHTAKSSLVNLEDNIV